MPAPGDQHSTIVNPYEETKPRISEFTASEIATLQSRLEKQLGPEYLSSRSGPSGQKVHYISADKCIALANDVFGFNGWSSSIQNIQVDFVDENPQTLKITLGLSVIVRVTLRDGTYHEDIGYGHIENCKGKAAAFEKAKKEGTTDGLKRALRSFGNVLGNCIYDKEYLAKVTKVKVAPTKFVEDNLHRHPDFAKKEPQAKAEPPKAEVDKNVVSNGSTTLLDDDFGEFDMADFGVTEDGHPDEVVLAVSHGVNAHTVDQPQTLSSGGGSDLCRDSTKTGTAQTKSMQPPPRSACARTVSNNPPRQQPATPNQPIQRPGAPNHGRPNPEQQNRQALRPPQLNSKPNAPPTTGNNMTPGPEAITRAQTRTPPPLQDLAAEPVAFFSARSVTTLPEDAPPGTAAIVPTAARLFDPRAESPSIRKTPGIDHRTSKPVGKGLTHVDPTIRHENAPVLPQTTAHPQPSRPAGGLNGTGSGNGHVSRNGHAVPTTAGRPSPMGPAAVNPALGHARQIGAPSGGSPLGNRGQYRPLTMKRSAPVAVGDSDQRAPLSELSANMDSGGGAGGNANSCKRQKTA